MLKKAWEVLALVVIFLVGASLAIESIKPYLPLLGLLVLGVIVAAVVRLVFFKRWFW